MKRNKTDIDRLIAELELDRAQLIPVADSNRRAAQRLENGATEDLDYAALGYTLHNLYGVMENACWRIAKFFENGLSSSNWHRELLDRMLLSIPGLRPALLTKDQYDLIDELRAFRHVFRNMYSRPLDTERLLLLQGKVPKIVQGFSEALSRYQEFLVSLRASVEEEG